MRKIYDQLDDRLVDFIGRQHVFFVGTAPDSPDGHLNVSPKGLDTFHILGPRTVAYLDLTGSGIETVAHIRQNGRHEKNRASIDGRAERAGYRRMVLDTLPEMVGAIALYRSLGFVETPPYWDCPVERAIFLERWLTS